MLGQPKWWRNWGLRKMPVLSERRTRWKASSRISMTLRYLSRLRKGWKSKVSIQCLAKSFWMGHGSRSNQNIKVAVAIQGDAIMKHTAQQSLEVQQAILRGQVMKELKEFEKKQECLQRPQADVFALFGMSSHVMVLPKGSSFLSPWRPRSISRKSLEVLRWGSTKTDFNHYSSQDKSCRRVALVKMKYVNMHVRLRTCASCGGDYDHKRHNRVPGKQCHWS